MRDDFRIRSGNERRRRPADARCQRLLVHDGQWLAGEFIHDPRDVLQRLCRWPCASTEPLRGVQKQRERFVGRRHLAGVFVGVHAVRELDAPHLDAVRSEPLRVPLCRPFARVVSIVGELHAPHLAQRFPKLIGKTFRAEQARHVLKAARVKRQRVEHRFAEDDFVALQRFPVEKAAMRPGRIEMLHLAALRPPAVKAHDVSRRVVERHGDAAVKMFVPAVAPQAQLREPRAQRLPGLAVLVRQPQPQRAVGEAELKTRNQFVAVESARTQVSPRGRRLLQPLVIVSRHLAEQRRVVRRRIERTRQPRHGRRRGRERRRAALAEQLEGVAEAAQAVVPLDELDGVARRAARHAVKESLGRADDEVRIGLVVMERAAPDKIFRAVRLQLDAPAAHQRHQVRAALDALDVSFRDSPGHRVS
ncbi:MAG: hypothetical protein BWX44_00598 [Spirochaetes bacterium ADurb.Bin001]|nr:MAG: hypothetical protein BWX44_00598 [Spirochaetes bacterium ADurb.Bin001]